MFKIIIFINLLNHNVYIILHTKDPRMKFIVNMCFRFSSLINKEINKFCIKKYLRKQDFCEMKNENIQKVLFVFIPRTSSLHYYLMSDLENICERRVCVLLDGKACNRRCGFDALYSSYFLPLMANKNLIISIIL